jgi:hypothetical protein
MEDLTNMAGTTQIKILNNNSYLLHLQVTDANLVPAKVVYVGTLLQQTWSAAIDVAVDAQGKYQLQLAWYPAPLTPGTQPTTQTLSASANQNIIITKTTAAAAPTPS